LEEKIKKLKKDGAVGINEMDIELNTKIWKKCSCGELITDLPKKFNIMMKTFVGPIESDTNVVYLRGEACQGIYMNFL